MLCILILFPPILETFWLLNLKFWHPVIKDEEWDKNEFKDGKLHGQTIQYGRHGAKMSETNYKINKMHGAMIIYGKRDKVIYHAIYKDGNLEEVVVSKGGQPKLRR